jgi:hypothetical protein
MRHWFLAVLFMIAMWPAAALAGVCAQSLKIPSDSPLLIEYQKSGAVMGYDPWVVRLRHPSDPRIVVDLGLTEQEPASKMDRAYMMRLERAALHSMRDHFKSSGLQVLAAEVKTTPRTGWQARALGDGLLHEYRSDRIGDGCALIASIRMPEAYATSTVPTRINAMVSTTAAKLVARHGSPSPRAERELPYGGTVLLMGLGLPLLFSGLLRLVAWRLDFYGKIPIGILYRIGTATPLLIGWGAFIWSLGRTMYGRGRLDNIELLLLAVACIVFTLFWLGSRRQHIAALGAILAPQAVVHAVYWWQGWHWEPAQVWWILGATGLAAGICALGARRTIQEMRAQKVIDERILEMLAREAD